MKNQTLATLMVLPISIAFFSGMFGIDNDGLYTLMGFGVVIFGTWGAVRLYKTPDAQ